MIIIDCVQGEPEWFAARLGIPTASEFNKVITPAKMEASKSADTYINKLVAEWLRGMADESFQSDWMKRGHEVEEEARDYYAFRFDVEVKQVGFCLEDAKRFGCSPDGLIGEDGGVEIKCCSAGVHVGYLLANKVPTEYRLQVLGSLLVTGREWWDFLSFHPDMEPLIVRTHYKDVKEDLIVLEKALIPTNKKIYDKKQILIKRGLKEAA